MPDSDTDVSELARQVVDELNPGSTIDDKVILSRRQLVAVAGGTLSVGALLSAGAGETQAAEGVGSVGTESEPNDVWASDDDGNVMLDDEVTSSSVTDGYEITIAGDTYEFVEES